MKVLTVGHRYELDSFEGGTPQTIQFIEKVDYLKAYELGIAPPLSEGQDSSTALITVHDGTTNEEVLAVLLDRLNTLNAKFPCRENALAITKIEEALMWLNRRTENRKARNVEGKRIA